MGSCAVQKETESGSHDEGGGTGLDLRIVLLYECSAEDKLGLQEQLGWQWNCMGRPGGSMGVGCGLPSKQSFVILSGASTTIEFGFVRIWVC